MRLIAGLALTGVAYSFGILGWLLLPGKYSVPTPVWIAAFAGAIVTFGPAIIASQKYESWDLGRKWWPLTRPRWVTRAVLAEVGALLFGLFVLGVVTARSRQPLPPLPPDIGDGQPEVADGQYLLNNHGVATPVSHGVYLHALRDGQRHFVMMALLFHVIAAITVGIVGVRAQPEPR